MKPAIDRLYARLASLPPARAGAGVLIAIVAGMLVGSLGAGSSNDTPGALSMVAPTVAPLPTATPTPEPPRDVPIRQAAVVPTPTPTPAPVVEANELGRIPVLMYHAFVYDEVNTDDWTITLDQFREQLDWLHANDFVAVGVRALLDRSFEVPAGKKPVVLTFDDANSTQFGFQVGPDGAYQVHPDTAVGILEEYRAAYPGFIQTAFFAVLPYNCFAHDDDPSTCEERLAWLVEHGYEIGNHTRGHQNLSLADDVLIKEEILEPIAWFEERVAGPGNLSHVLVLPFGMYPAEEHQVDWLFKGFWHHGEFFVPALVLEVTGGPTRSPFHINWGTNVTRLNTDPGTFWFWADRMSSGEVDIFVSDGDPATVTVPAGWEAALNEPLLAEEGRQLRVWPAEAAAGESGG